MTKKLTLALDAMGGDNAPEIVVEGAEIARQRRPDLHFLMVGDEARIAPLLARHKKLQPVAEILHTEDVIAADAKPSSVLRSGKTSSMRLAIEAVRDGTAAGVVSAGNTGVLMAFSKMVFRTLPGVDRPAMASFFPTQRGETVMLDLGANLVCDTENLVQFAILGEVFTRTVFGMEEPTVGLLNVGTEDQKGHEYVREAATILRENGLLRSFKGFIEGSDIAKGTVDVVVTDGWSGNIAIKTAEGTGRLMTAALTQSFRSSLAARFGYLFAAGALRKLRIRLDPRRYNGAIFLGVDGIAVKSHGGSDGLAFATAIDVAADMAHHGFIERVKDEFASMTTVSTGASRQTAAG